MQRRSMRERLMKRGATEVPKVAPFQMSMDMISDPYQPENDTSMLQATVWKPQTRTHGADARLNRERQHLLNPIRRKDFDIIVKQADVLALYGLHCAIV